MGMQVPISFNNKFEILDGMTRYKISQALGMAAKAEAKPKIFPDKLSEKLWVIDANLERRQLSKFQKIELRLKKKPLLQKLAKLNMLGGVKVNPSQKFGKGVNQSIGKESGSSNETVRKVQILLENSNAHELDRLRTGQVSISHAFTNYKRSQDHRITPKLPKDQFDVLLADPPYRYEINLRDSAEQHYSTMDYKEIAEIKVPSANNCVLFLWATQPLIREALYVMKKWGFDYKSGAVWVKDRIGNGYYFRFRHELLLIGVKGKMPIPEENDRPDSVIQTARTIHSEKPKMVYELVESMYPNRKYLELFARSKHNEKWCVWGLEAPMRG